MRRPPQPAAAAALSTGAASVRPPSLPGQHKLGLQLCALKSARHAARSIPSSTGATKRRSAAGTRDSGATDRRSPPQRPAGPPALSRRQAHFWFERSPEHARVLMLGTIWIQRAIHFTPLLPHRLQAEETRSTP